MKQVCRILSTRYVITRLVVLHAFIFEIHTVLRLEKTLVLRFLFDIMNVVNRIGKRNENLLEYYLEITCKWRCDRNRNLLRIKETDQTVGMRTRCIWSHKLNSNDPRRFGLGFDQNICIALLVKCECDQLKADLNSSYILQIKLVK